MNSNKASFGKETALRSHWVRVLMQPFQRRPPPNLFPLTPGWAPTSNTRPFGSLHQLCTEFWVKSRLSALLSKPIHHLGAGCLRELLHAFWSPPLTGAVIHPKISVSRGTPVSAAGGCLPCCWLLPPGEPGEWLPAFTSPEARGTSHFVQLTRTTHATHAKYCPRCWEHRGRWAAPFTAAEVPGTAKGPAPDERMGMEREGMARENSSVPPSSPSLPAGSTTENHGMVRVRRNLKDYPVPTPLPCFMGGSETLVVDSYAIGFLV